MLKNLCSNDCDSTSDLVELLKLVSLTAAMLSTFCMCIG